MYVCIEVALRGDAHGIGRSNWAKGRDPSVLWVQYPNPAVPSAPPGQQSRLGAREAHQHLVGGIVRATGPDPFGNGMPLPTYPWGPCVGPQWQVSVSPDLISNNGTSLVVWLCLSHCLQSCLLYTSPSPRDRQKSRMPSSA